MNSCHADAVSQLFFQISFVALVLAALSQCAGNTVSDVNEDNYSLAKDRRYLLYDVNPGEGFNLRRDVYLRVSNLVRQLREKGHNFALVLPPWGPLYHWQSRSLGNQVKLPWSLFFDVQSLHRFVPVLEFEQYLDETNHSGIDKVLYLQHYAEGWTDGKFDEKWDVRPCIGANDHYQLQKDDQWHGWFWGFGSKVFAHNLACISVQGHSNTLLDVVLHENHTDLDSIMIDRFETVLHDHFGDRYYWQARRSMRYSKKLRDIADEYRQTTLQSNDHDDQTIILDDWNKTQPKHGLAIGGPYVAVHWRRKDFLRAHGPELPSVNGTAHQIVNKLKELNLNAVFLATDAKATEVEELTKLVNNAGYELDRFTPQKELLDVYKDGGISIIDQWICAHARCFIGSYVSTFSFRIHEDREILGFSPNTTFNRLCPDDRPNDCEQPAKWTIVY